MGKIELEKGETVDSLLKKIDMDRLPEHIAIIMDGNGRWAKKRFLPRTAGHRKGVERVKDIVKAAGNLGIKYLTVYAFSTENWKRPKDEVNSLMTLLIEFLNKELEEMHSNNIKIKVLGDLKSMPLRVRDEVEKSIEKTKNNTKMVFNIALNYGGRQEILEGIKRTVTDINNNKIKIEDLDEELFGNYLYTANQADPDILIRTSGEERISNFLLYQMAYTEFVFTDVFWPDFKEEIFYKCIIEFQHRKRRFGGI
ncbi:isoprenyl transferase UppS [Gottschalkia purinilytica]|uniref:Isoprenyl transferase n=1 Tax=Gottschalkia purinilytica TaxID=1503 RepID=A0A0L0WBE4_GOTPU|nr:isoprenyl transferase [Gottschalkia purinilytica]KNF08849.1 isoprenyl transferase UppS [Gottschalkia purinilytica]